MNTYKKLRREPSNKDVSKQSNTNITSPWAKSPERILKQLEVDTEKGLSKSEVIHRLDHYGYNQLKKHKKKSLWQILADQLKSLIILLLVVATGISFLYDEIVEGWAILIVILINTAIGFFTELRAVRSMESLFMLGKVETRVRREGSTLLIDARDLVPGDIVLFEGGDVITADLRIVEASKLQADESTLTGESMPVSKDIVPVNSETVLAERTSMLYKGTSITRGSGVGVVVSTGLKTELGQISSLTEGASEERTPLEERLDRLGYRLIWLTLAIAVFIVTTGIYSGKDPFLMIETGIALAVAAIPEGLPIVATIALAKGLGIMAEKNALINRLSSVETLGATGTIFSDKTGTLTENKMVVTRLLLSGQSVDMDSELADGKINTTDENSRLALEIGMLCNNAEISNQSNGKGIGDPLEVALLEIGARAGLTQKELLKKYPEAREEAFDAEVKMMATWNEIESGQYRVSVKGAPDTVLQNCNLLIAGKERRDFPEVEKKRWESLNEEMAAEGLRVIALAFRETNTTEGNPYENLVFVGLVGLLDPPRKDVKKALESCQEAGIRVIMVTGDQPNTAAFIAQSVGLASDKVMAIHGKDLPSPEELAVSDHKLSEILDANIFARISPKQKLDLIELYQKNGHIVAMTGDGVNDAPALKKADIGIAMGKRGTQVAKEASDMVLTDDAFSTIVAAIKQGRAIFGNIRRFVYYLLSCNVSEVLVVAIASIVGTILPILPLQILFLNLVTDIFPALALGVGEGTQEVMQQPPRKSDEQILTRKHWTGIAGYGLLITAAVLSSLYVSLHWLNLEGTAAVTISFLTLAFAQLWHVFNMRDQNSGIFNNSIVKNHWIWGAVVLCIFLLLGAIYIPSVSEVMRLTPPDMDGWMVIVVMSLIPLSAGQFQKEMGKWLSRRRKS